MDNELTEVMINVDLRDIHLPADVPWWPLANGWWFMLILFIILIASTYFFRHYYFKRYSLSYLARKEFHQIKEQSYSSEANFKALYLLLRRISRLLPGAKHYNRDQSCQWFIWLLEHSKLPLCSEELQQQLTRVPYTNKINQSLKTEELEQLTIRIIDTLPDIRLLEDEVLLHMENNYVQ